MFLFNHIVFLTSYTTEISNPLDVKTVHFEGRITNFRTPATSSEQRLSEVLKKISPLPADSQHRLASRKKTPIQNRTLKDQERERQKTNKQANKQS
jgi:hypothetical protein